MKKIISLACTFLVTFSVACSSQASTDQPQADHTQNHSVVECAHAILQAFVDNQEHDVEQLPDQICSSYAALFIKHTQGISIPMAKKIILLLGFDLLYNQQNAQKDHYLRASLINSILSYFTINASPDYSYHKHQNLYRTTTELRRTLDDLIENNETSENQAALHKAVLQFTTTLYTHGLILESSWTYTDYAWFGLKVATTLSTLVAMLVVIKKTVSADLGKVIGEASRDISAKTSESLERSFDKMSDRLAKQAPVIIDSVAKRAEKVIDKHWPATLETLAKMDVSQIASSLEPDKLLQTLTSNKATQKNVQEFNELLTKIRTGNQPKT